MSISEKFLNLPQLARISIALIVVGIIFLYVCQLEKKEEKREQTFIPVCWNDFGFVRYVVNPDEATCDDPKPLQWYEEPKLVYWNLDQDFDSYYKSHLMALEWWNKQLGRKHFVITGDLSIADIVIEQGDAILHYGSMMHTTHRKDEEGAIRATIRAVEFADIRQWMLFEQHELGHAAFGLAHDYAGNSIMREVIEEPNGQEYWYLTDKDRKAILDSLNGK